MMQFFKYYYYRMFNHFSEVSSIALFRTFAVMFVFLYFNLLALSTLIFSVGLNVRIALPVGSGMWWLWPLMFIVPMFILFYFRLKEDGLHDLIFEQYSQETRKQRVKGGWFVILYFIGSILLFIFALWLRQAVRGY